MYLIQTPWKNMQTHESSHNLAYQKFMKTPKLMRFNDFPNKQASTPIIFQISLQKIQKFKQTNNSIAVESTHT